MIGTYFSTRDEALTTIAERRSLIERGEIDTTFTKEYEADYMKQLEDDEVQS